MICSDLHPASSLQHAGSLLQHVGSFVVALGLFAAVRGLLSSYDVQVFSSLVVAHRIQGAWAPEHVGSVVCSMQAL